MALPFRPHVLVVDDDPSVREALTAALADRYAVHAAASGAEACAILGTHPIAVIVLDALLGDDYPIKADFGGSETLFVRKTTVR